MKKIRRIRDKVVLHPIMTLCILILFTIVLSGILTLFNTSANYSRISASGTYVKEFVSVENLFSLSGIKYIFSNAVSNFASFAPLSMLIISLIGFGIMDKSGFLDSFFYIFTKRVSKKTVTFSLSLLCIFASIGGDISYIVLIPLAASLFKYGKRHPKAGIVCAFASLSCGIGINLFMNSIDSSLLSYTSLGAKLLSSDYNIGSYAYILIMLVAAITLAFIITSVTEKIIVPKLGHYELTDETEDYLTKSEKRGLVFSLGAGIAYLCIFIYNIIPNAPLGGYLLDYTQTLYIDKLFGYNSFFNHGFVFVVTLLFFILGLVYGITSKSIKNQHDLFSSLSYSLDKIGKVLVLIFFASTLIFVFKKTNIGSIITAGGTNLINSSGFTGIPLIILLFIVSIVCTLFLPSSVAKWSILSGTVVPVFMNAGMSPEFATVIFRAGESVSYGSTPIMAYFVIYLAFMENYNVDERQGLFGNLKYILPYAGYTFIMWLILIIGFYLIGLPLGIGIIPSIMIIKGYIFTYLYLLLIILVTEFLNKKCKVRTKITRKIVHIFVSFSYLIMYYYFDCTIHIIVPPITFIVINYISYKKNLFEGMNDSTNSLGTIYYPISVLIMSIITYFVNDFYYAYGLGLFVMAFGDGLAPLVAGFLSSR